MFHHDHYCIFFKKKYDNFMFTQYIFIYVSAFIIMLSAFSGKMLLWGAFGKYMQKNMRFLVTLALGVFSFTLFLLFKEAREMQASLSLVAFGSLLGILLLEFIQKIIPEAHHHHGADNEQCCNITNKINPKRILIGDAFHNIGDGIALTSAYLISIKTGIILTIGIFIHEFVQESSEFFLLREAGYSVRKALLSNFLVQSSIFLGIFAIFLFDMKEIHRAFLTSIALGMLFFIIIRDLLPHTIERIKHKDSWVKHLLLWVIGLVLMFLVSNIVKG